MGSIDGMSRNVVNFSAGPAKLPEEVRMISLQCCLEFKYFNFFPDNFSAQLNHNEVELFRHGFCDFVVKLCFAKVLSIKL